MMSKRRSSALRKAGWLAVTGLLATAVLGPGASPILANDLHQDAPIAWDATGYEDENCPPLEIGSVLWHFVQNQVPDNVASGKLTAEFDVEGEVTVDSYKKSGGVLHWQIITGQSTLLGAESDVTSDGPLNLSHICVGPEESEQPSEAPSEQPSEAPSEQPSEAPSEQPSEAPSEQPSEAPSEQPSEAPSEQPSEAPSEQPSEAPSEQPSDTPSEQPSTPPSEAPSTSPSGGVEAATGTPRVTPPPTDAFGTTSTPSSDAWRLMLIAMAGLLATVLVLTPARKSVRRD